LTVPALKNKWSDGLLALMAILAVATALRLHGLSFGLPAVNDPDELIFELGAIKMLAEGTLNPGWFGHPATTTMYVLALIDVLVFLASWLAGSVDGIQEFSAWVYRDPGVLMLPHRVAMVGFSVGTVWLTAQLARRVWNDRTAPAVPTIAGITAAALLAVNPVHMIWSQVIRSDVMGCLFLLLCLLASLDIAERGRRADYVRAAAWLALAIATKWPFALGVLAVVGAVVLRLRQGVQMRSMLGALALTGGLTLAFLVAISPFLVLAWPTVVANLAGEAQQQHLGATGGTPLENLVWYARGAIYSGLGPAGVVLTGLGLWHGRRNHVVLALLLPVSLGFIAAMALQHIVWERWTLPLTPILSVLAGGGMAHLAKAIAPLLHGRNAHSAAWLASIAMIAAPLGWLCWERGTERLDDTRQQATRWAVAHIPEGDTILIEHFGFDLLARNWAFRFPLGDLGCVDARPLLAGKVQYGLISSGRGSRSNIDYGTLDPGTRTTCKAQWAILTQADRYAAEAHRFPSETGAYRALIASGRQAAVFAPASGISAGPIVRIIDLRR